MSDTKKIILGYEFFDQTTTSGWNLNGRIKAPIVLRQPFRNTNQWVDDMYKVVIDPHSHPNSFKLCPPLFGGIPAPNEHVNLTVYDIPDSDIYFYPILIINAGLLYDRYVTSIEVSEKVKADVRSGKAYIIFIYDNEPDIKHVYNRFCELVSNMQLPKEQIILFHADPDVHYFKDAPFLYKYILSYNYWIRINDSNDRTIIEYQPEKLFLMYNRTVRPQKQIMLGSLIEHDLLDHAIYSCGKLTLSDLTHTESYYGYTMSDKQKNGLLMIQGTSPDKSFTDEGMVLDGHSIPKNEYIKTFLSLVTETYTHINFYSEKTFKPIFAGHPFIILAAQGHLRMLREMGYRTFGDYWNEDYDEVSNVVQKVEKITSIISNLKKLSTTELIAMRESMRPILEHNKNVFMESRRPLPYGRYEPIKNELLRIVNSRHQ